ncbi:ECF transporter S component [Bifidobacterium aemilianum]|uniref:ECF transporter S component n=2 Tax=Bifidobacterium aemilianum TaxID=2493120 RepID=A0A366KC13_9BIFI|nr:ECF transporter S component [Bifidobacterium aemilianum]RBP98663.1 ECF transporter S component [Bifidobacterium aemilianum]
MSLSKHADSAITDDVTTANSAAIDEAEQTGNPVRSGTAARPGNHSTSASNISAKTPNSLNGRDPHGTGISDTGRWSTKRIAIYALFVALSMVSSFISVPLMPGVPWLKYDPSGIVCLLAGFAYGPSAAVIVSVLGFLPHLLTNQWGFLVAVLVALALSVPASLVYRRIHTRKGAVISLVLGGLCALAMAIVTNLLITPIYAHMSVGQVVAMILPILLPFNLIKFTIHGVVTFLIYKPVSKLLHD